MLWREKCIYIMRRASWPNPPLQGEMPLYHNARNLFADTPHDIVLAKRDRCQAGIWQFGQRMGYDQNGSPIKRPATHISTSQRDQVKYHTPKTPVHQFRSGRLGYSRQGQQIVKVRIPFQDQLLPNLPLFKNLQPKN